MSQASNQPSADHARTSAFLHYGYLPWQSMRLPSQSHIQWNTLKVDASLTLMDEPALVDEGVRRLRSLFVDPGDTTHVVPLSGGLDSRAILAGLIDAGAREAGRNPADVELAPFVAIIPLDDVALARSFVKPGVSFYIGGMGVYYHEMFCRYGFKENADHVRDLYARGLRQEAAAAVSDDLIDAIAICGPAAHCRERLADWRAEGLGTALMNLPTGVPFEVTEQVLRTVAPGR